MGHLKVGATGALETLKLKGSFSKVPWKLSMEFQDSLGIFPVPIRKSSGLECRAGWGRVRGALDDVPGGNINMFVPSSYLCLSSLRAISSLSEVKSELKTSQNHIIKASKMKKIVDEAL